MSRFLLIFSTLFFLPFYAHAQGIVQDIDVVQEPICFVVVNEAPYSVYGTITTNYYVRDDGERARHRSNFRFGANGSKHETEGYPTDRAEFCSYGPFYEDRKLYLTLRTLIPIFSCKTKIDQGPIFIKGYRDPDTGPKTWAECYE